VAYFDNNFDDRLLRVQRDPLPADEFKFERLLLDDDVPDDEELIGVAERESGSSPALGNIPGSLPSSITLAPLWPRDRVQILPREQGLVGRWSVPEMEKRVRTLTGHLGLELGPPTFGLIEVSSRSAMRNSRSATLVGGSATFEQRCFGVPLLGAGLGLTLRDDAPGWFAGLAWRIESQMPDAPVIREAEARRQLEARGQTPSASPGRLCWRSLTSEGRGEWRPFWRFQQRSAGGDSEWLEVSAVREAGDGGGR